VIALHVSIRDGMFSPTQIVVCLLSHVLAVDVEYPIGRLCAIARAVGWKDCTAALGRSAIIRLLNLFWQSCTSDRSSIEPSSLFRSFERLSRGSLLALGVLHGVTLVGGCEDMGETIMAHISHGDCASNQHRQGVHCSLVVARYTNLTDR
jgi:hypothetical protein